LLEALALWGIEHTVARLNGMFAFAAFDTTCKKLFLARDHLGIKPLYYGCVGGTFFFGSELKAFAPHPAWQPTLSRQAVAAYMRSGYMPHNQSIWEGISQLPPGTFAVVDVQTLDTQVHQYWSVADAFAAGQQNPLPVDTSDADAIAGLDALLRDSVARQLVSDVPIGAFLSGGIDSSAVVALMQAQSAQPVKTFSIGFHVEGYNEAEHAKKVAQHLGTEHTELYVTPEDALATVPDLSAWYDEPFADSSQIPTYMVSKMARQHVTVTLSGDGGDEMFGGYGRYAQALAAQATLATGQMKWQLLSGLVQPIPNPLLNAMGRMLPGRFRRDDFANRLKNYIRNQRGDPHDLYLGMLSQWSNPSAVVKGADEPLHPAQMADIQKNAADLLTWMQHVDSISYLPGDILTKVDRASMAVSLESRVPLLDYRVFEYACRLPYHMKIRDGKAKWLLRQVLYQYVPPVLIDRPKMGFGVPIDAWLRGPLKEWAWSRLNPDTLKKHDVLEPDIIQAYWKAHQAGTENWQFPLWTAIMLHDWLERQAG
jgi:asparagine synthase (glutamine-hydrolysing)